jgi:hypothetical protein
MMYFKFIFIIILIILIILIIDFNKKNNKKKFEQLINVNDNIKELTYLYMLNNKNFNYYIKNINNLISFNNTGNYINENYNTDISGVIDISGTINIKGSTNFLNTDIRHYFIGCSIFNINSNSVASKYANSGIKLDLHLGIYNFTQDTNKAFNDYIDLIMVYPGFGVYAWEHYFNVNNNLGQSIIIENYGTKPLRVSLINGTNLNNDIHIPSNAPIDSNIVPVSLLYNTDPLSYKITKSTNFSSMNKKVSVINVYLLPMNKWLQHKP